MTLRSEPTISSDLSFTGLPVVTVQAQDFGSHDLEAQEKAGTNAKVSVVQSASQQNALRVIAVFLAVAAIVGSVVGVVIGTKNDSINDQNTGGQWNQPTSRQRSLRFSPSFASCQGLREAFGETSDGETTSTAEGVESLFVEHALQWWPQYPQDYCDTCSCEDGWQPPVFYTMYTDDVVMEAASADSSGAATKSAADEYTGTNNQVEGVDESDIIKTDGQFVYILPRNEPLLVIATAYPFDEVAVVSSTNLTEYNMAPREMLLDGDRLVVIGSAQVKEQGAEGASLGLVAMQLWDVADRAAPALLQTQQVEGGFSTARLIDGFAYAVVQTWPYAYYWAAAGMPQPLATTVSMVADHGFAASEPYGGAPQRSMARAAPLARVLRGEEGRLGGAGDVPLTPIAECGEISTVEGLGSADSWLTIMSLATTSGATNNATHAGRGGNVYVAESSVYIAATNYDYFADGNRDKTGQLPGDGVWTGVLKFKIEGGAATFEHLVEVPGSVLNQFAMDEYEGFFRIATTYGEVWGRGGESVSGVYVFDAAGERTGEVEGLAPGERIFAARFQGPKAYVVTFRQVDPLFVLDLSDPARPVELGQLKIPGWSDYLHPVNATHLLGFGKAATAEGQVEGLKLSLFDVSDPAAPREQATLALGDRGTDSEAARDHKAFLFEPSSGLIAFPISLRRIAPDTPEEERAWAWGELELEGAAVVFLGESGFAKPSYISHHAEGKPSDKYGGWGSAHSIVRTGFMAAGDGASREEVLFSYSQRQLRVHALPALAAPLAIAALSAPVCYVPE